jgi:4-diphosphocytidyl-2C-methyl-D-erythritol kinase
VRIHLEKRIPVGAGLGGGSSDAAATLVGLNALLKLRFDDAQLHALARELGSDVPYFLIGGLCRGRGRGEVLTRLAQSCRTITFFWCAQTVHWRLKPSIANTTRLWSKGGVPLPRDSSKT